MDTDEPIRNPDTWPSLAGQIALAAELFGDTGRDRLARWLSSEFDRVDDADFARTFSEHISLPGIVSADFGHRVVRSAHGALLGGIRFYGRDIDRPFVEIICHDFTDTDALADCVRHEWSGFEVRWARLHDRPRPLEHRMVLDYTVHAARCADMPVPDGRVWLSPFDDPEHAVQVVSRRYRDVAETDPELAGNVRPADPDDLRTWHADGHLHAVTTRSAVVGALAVLPGRVLWIDGYEINEEVISTTHRGQGHAAAAQAAWAHQIAVDQQALLVGTIDRLNAASRFSAQHAGRDAIVNAVFLRLSDPVSAQ